MPSARTSVFWSYSRDDDAFDRGRIVRLAEDLRAELALLAPEPPRMFVDRDSIEWGAEWKRVIDAALAESALLVSIVTPRYFTRSECRRELLTFHREAGGRELAEVVLPILYAPVADLVSDSPDEAVALVARTHFHKWTDLRLASVDSVEYRRAVNALAERILELIAASATAQVERESQSADDGALAEEDLAELLVKADALWPDWLDAVQIDEVNVNQHDAVMSTYSARRDRLRASRAKASAVMATFLQQGAALLPLAKQHAHNAEVYSARTIELDPVVRACVRMGRDRPALLSVLRELSENVGEAAPRVELWKRQISEGRNSPREFTEQMPYVPQNWKEVIALDERASTLIHEANSIVSEWIQGFERVFSGEAEALVADGTECAEPPGTP